MAQRQDLILLASIEETFKKNEALVDSIRTKNKGKRFSYYLGRDGEGLYTVTEYQTEATYETAMSNWTPDFTLTVPLDCFNDDLDYEVKSFVQLCDLSLAMLKVARKFKLFGGSQDAVDELVKYKWNFEVIQEALQLLEKETGISEGGSLPEIEQRLEQVNAVILDFTTFVKKVSFDDPCTWMITPSTSHKVSEDFRTAETIQSQQGCLLSSVGYSSGVHVWRLKIHQRNSTCMFGVAPDTVSKTSLNYSNNGFFVDLNGGTKYSGAPFSYSCTGYASTINAGDVLILTLDCDKHTLSYDVNGKDFGAAYTNLPAVKLFLAWDNDTTGGSKIEII